MTPPNPDYPVRLDVDYPPRLSRLLIFVKWLLLIPHYLALWLLGIIAWFAILITGRYPEALFNAVTVALRWTVRTTLYTYWAVERYPAFVWA